jgi:ubiquitin C-terminal hydrolase
VKQSLYRLPDILIIHIKRFNMTARFREKIRAKVDYPLQDLDMRPFTVQVQSEGSPESANGESIGPTDGNVKISSNEDVYDLYGVSNHLGKRILKS